MAEFVYHDPFPLAKDDTEYKLLTNKFVTIAKFDGEELLRVDPEGLAYLARAAMREVSFLLRTEHLQHHAGQVSFPGGRVEGDDEGILGAALREAEEEIGLAPGYIEPLGLLDDYETVTHFLVTPVVSIVKPGFTLTLDTFEVADAFEVPLSFLLDPDNHQIHSRIRNGERRRYYVFEYGERYIWGATAGMLMNFYRRLHGLDGPMRPPPDSGSRAAEDAR